METKHTPGRLKADKSRIDGAVSDSLWVLRASKPVFVTTDVVAVSNTGQADAERLAACWNACAGISDPEATITALVAALREAGEAIHSEYCTQRHHAECEKVTAALTLVGDDKP